MTTNNPGRIFPAMSDPMHEASARVLRAWTLEGPAPMFHAAAQDDLRRTWPTLAGALDNLAAAAAGDPDANPGEAVAAPRTAQDGAGDQTPTPAPETAQDTPARPAQLPSIGSDPQDGGTESA